MSHIDEQIREAKHYLDSARRDGDPEAIARWVIVMDRRLDRKLADTTANSSVAANQA